MTLKIVYRVKKLLAWKIKVRGYSRTKICWLCYGISS